MRISRALLTPVLVWLLTLVPAFSQSDGLEPNLQLQYLQENAQKPGVIKRLSGLQIRIIERGDGNFPNKDDVVVVHYEGKLIDGTIFDSSYAKGEPVVFPIKGVIRGWQEALVLMTVGSKWELILPAKIAYGDAGASELIPPGATLVFTVELLEIK